MKTLKQPEKDDLPLESPKKNQMDQANQGGQKEFSIQKMQALSISSSRPLNQNPSFPSKKIYENEFNTLHNNELLMTTQSENNDDYDDKLNNKSPQLIFTTEEDSHQSNWFNSIQEQERLNIHFIREHIKFRQWEGIHKYLEQLAPRQCKESNRHLETLESEDNKLQADNGTEQGGILLHDTYQMRSQPSELIISKKQKFSNIIQFCDSPTFQSQKQIQYSDSPTIKFQKQSLKKMRTDFFDRKKTEVLSQVDINNNNNYNNNQDQLIKVNSPANILKNNRYPNNTWRNSQVAPLITAKNEQKIELKKWNIFNRIGMTLKVKQKFTSLISQRISKLNSYERKLIGDITDTSYERKIGKQHQNRLLNYILQIKFHPGSLLIILFKLFMIVVTFYNIIYIPMFISFTLPYTPHQQLIHSLSTFFFLAEILIKFRTAVYDKGEVHYTDFIIAKKYLSEDFITDMFSLIGYIVGGTSQQFLSLIILLRVSNLRNYLDDINNHFYLTEKFYQFWVLTKLFVLIIIMNHYFACIFHYIGIIFANVPVDTWIKSQDLQNSDWEYRYVCALYFSFITCMTIGFGDIVPRNNSERLSVIIYSFISTILFSYSVNIIGNIFDDYYAKYQKQVFMRYNAINFMSKRSINKDLQMRVLKYIDYIQEIEKDSSKNGLQVINQISNHLKQSIFSDCYGKILLQNKHFALNYSKATIEKLTMKIQEKLYVPGEIIFDQGEQDSRLFYLIKGECEQYLQNKEGNKHSEFQSIALTSENTFFGYKEFMSGIPREMSCRSTNISHAFFISREDMISVLKEDPVDYEQFCKLRDEYQFYSNSLGEKCLACKSFGHTLMQCSRIHLIRNRQLVVMKYNYTKDQQRVIKLRENRKYSSLQNIDITSFNAKKYRKHLVLDLQKTNENTIDLQEFENCIDCLLPDEEFSRHYPYIKFIDEEMVVYNGMEEIQEMLDENDEYEYDNYENEKEMDGYEGKNYDIEEQDDEEGSVSDVSISNNKTMTQIGYFDHIINETREDQDLQKQKISPFINTVADKNNQEDIELDIRLDLDSDKHDVHLPKFKKQYKKQKTLNQNENLYPINEVVMEENKLESVRNDDLKQGRIIQPFSLIHAQRPQTFPNIMDLSIQNIKEEEKQPNQNTQNQLSSDSHSNIKSIKFMNLANISYHEAEQGGQGNQGSSNSQNFSVSLESETLSKQQSVHSQKSGQSQLKKNGLKLKINGINLGTLPLVKGSSFKTTAKTNAEFTKKQQLNLNILKKIKRLSNQSALLQNGVTAATSNEQYCKKQYSGQSQNKESFSRTSSFKSEYNQQATQLSPKSLIRRFTTFAGVDFSSLQDYKSQQGQLSKSNLKLKRELSTQNKDHHTSHYQKQNYLLHQILWLLQNKVNSKNTYCDEMFTFNPKNIQNLTPTIEQNVSERRRSIPYNFNYTTKPTQNSDLNKRMSSCEQLSLFIFDFDSMKEYQRYFPHNNASNICLYTKWRQENKKRSSNYNYFKPQQQKGKDNQSISSSQQIIISQQVGKHN